MLEVLDKPETCRLASPITRETYHAMLEKGILGPKNELLWGVIVEKISKSPLHQFWTDQLRDLIQGFLKNGYFIRTEGPLGIENSEPEPDFSIVAGSRSDFRLAHPETAELVVEVAVSSLAIDREKASLYASANVPQYWILNLNDQTLEVYSQPLDGKYQSCEVKQGEKVAVPCTENLSLDLAELFA